MKNIEKENIVKQDINEVQMRIFQLSKISLLLDSYDDIFSDFDPRPYSQRALSDDFLNEAKRASRDRASGTIELRFLVPAHIRNQNNELIIQKRLREHFKKHRAMIKKEITTIINQGIAFTIAGIMIMLITTFILLNSDYRNFLMSFSVVLLEPAGWFLFWEGLDLIIFKSKIKKPDLEFNDKIEKCEMTFLSY